MVFNTYLNRDKQVEGSQSNESMSNEHGSRREPPYGYGGITGIYQLGAQQCNEAGGGNRRKG